VLNPGVRSSEVQPCSRAPLAKGAAPWGCAQTAARSHAAAGASRSQTAPPGQSPASGGSPRPGRAPASEAQEGGVVEGGGWGERQSACVCACCGVLRRTRCAQVRECVGAGGRGCRLTPNYAWARALTGGGLAGVDMPADDDLRRGRHDGRKVCMQVAGGRKLHAKTAATLPRARASPTSGSCARPC